MSTTPFATALLAVSLAVATLLPAQETGRSLDLGIGGVGLSIGDSRQWKGIRLNARDASLERMDGIHVTLLGPRGGRGGDVRGIALGVPATGGRSLRGVSVALAGFGATESLTGVGAAGLGLGSGGSLRGVHAAGLGIGAGRDVRGVVVGGLGVGSGGDMRGVIVGGLGIAAKDSLRGVSVAGLGIGAGREARGVLVAGLGIGAGELLDGLAVAGLGVGARAVRGIAIGGLGVGAHDLLGLAVSGALVRVVDDGRLRGAAVAPVTWVQGAQRGLSVGLVNYAWSLTGVQLGLVNIVRDNPRPRRVLPLVNWGR